MISLLLNDLPFFVIRLTTIIQYDFLIGNLVFILKNILFIVLDTIRLLLIFYEHRQRRRRRDDGDGADAMIVCDGRKFRKENIWRREYYLTPNDSAELSSESDVEMRASVVRSRDEGSIAPKVVEQLTDMKSSAAMRHDDDEAAEVTSEVAEQKTDINAERSKAQQRQIVLEVRNETIGGALKADSQRTDDPQSSPTDVTKIDDDSTKGPEIDK